MQITNPQSWISINDARWAQLCLSTAFYFIISFMARFCFDRSCILRTIYKFLSMMHVVSKRHATNGKCPISCGWYLTCLIEELINTYWKCLLYTQLISLTISFSTLERWLSCTDSIPLIHPMSTNFKLNKPAVKVWTFKQLVIAASRSLLGFGYLLGGTGGKTADTPTLNPAFFANLAIDAGLNLEQIIIFFLVEFYSRHQESMNNI